MADEKKAEKLRLKVNMTFGGGLVLPAGEYEGDNIPDELHKEYESDSPHVESIVVAKKMSLEEKKKEDDAAAKKTPPKK